MIRRIFGLLVVSVISYVALGEGVSTQEQLAVGRQQIDKIDRQIVDLINQRATVVKRIGEIKSAARLPISVPSREQAVLRHVAEFGTSGPFPTVRLKTIYSTLLDQMRDWEAEQQQSEKSSTPSKH